NAREMAAAGQERLSPDAFQRNMALQSDLSFWSAHIVDMVVDPHADYIGKTLQELAWREQYGVNIAYIRRGDKLIHAPNRDNRIFPHDHVGIIATDDQMQLFKPAFHTV